MTIVIMTDWTTSFRSVFLQYWDLGLASFGGPAVHVIILRRRFVERLKWVDERTFLDLFALGNALPGPGSTQLAFSIAVVTHGVYAGLLAFLLWSLPGAIGMAAIGAGISSIPGQLPGIVLALLTGLNAAAVGLIALAAYQLGAAAGTDHITLWLIWLGASFGICYHAPWMYPTLIVAGGVGTLLWDSRRRVLSELRMLNRQPALQDPIHLEPRSQQAQEHGVNESSTLSVASGLHQVTTRPSLRDSGVVQSTRDAQVDLSTVPGDESLNVVSTRTATVIIMGFVLLLTGPLAIRAGLSNAGKAVPRGLDYFANMLIAGTIIFGGGPVVIPLLRDYVVVEGWVSSRDFLLVFAILQAFPGPNFNFAVALGWLACPQYRPLGAVLGYFGIFSPGIILKLGLLPFYVSWRGKPLARSILRGLNAVAAGLVFTATWQLFLIGYIYQSPAGLTDAQEQTVSGPLTGDPFWAVVSSGSFLATHSFKSPPWLSVFLGGLAGMAWYGATRS